ncbi:MAG: 50S ribosomal protein L22 [Chloroflexi bacterium]|nr:50S ribosomal protein L22 [Chloroflexota bacterium]
MQVQATAKYLRVSPRKARRVAATVTGRPAGEALAILRFLPSPTARTLAKVVRSAVANAENTYNLDPAELTVANVLVDKGPVFRRIDPKARGQWGLIRRRTSHVTVIVENEEYLSSGA